MTTRSERIFLDTNVVLYSVSGAPDKARAAQQLLDRGGVVSVQVLNEFTDISRRRFAADWAKVRDGLETISMLCEIVPLTHAVHERAVGIAVAAKLRIYDACIVAAAQLAECEVLFSEDLNPGQRFGSVTVRNPFAER